MPNNTYAIVGAKGGVGKTTTSFNLGAALASRGCSVVTVELDLGMANLVDFVDTSIDVDEETTLHDVFAGEAAVDSACYQFSERFSIAISGTDLTGYADTDLSRLSDVVRQLRRDHDVVLLDTPAGLSAEVVRPLQSADRAILVSTPRVAAVRNAQNTIELVDSVGTDIRGLVLTKSGTGASPGAPRIAEFLDVELLGHVPEDDAVPHSQDHGEPVVDYAPRSGAALAYGKIADQLVDDEGIETDRIATGSPPSSRGSTESGDAGAQRRASDTRPSAQGASGEADRTGRTGSTKPEVSTTEHSEGTTVHGPSGSQVSDTTGSTTGEAVETPSETDRTDASAPGAGSSSAWTDDTVTTSESDEASSGSTAADDGADRSAHDSADVSGRGGSGDDAQTGSEDSTTQRVRADGSEPDQTDAVEGTESSDQKSDGEISHATSRDDGHGLRERVRSFIGL